MKRLPTRVLLAVLAVTALVVAACGGGSNKSSSSSGSTAASGGGTQSVNQTQGSGLTIAMVTHSDEGSFWSVVKKGAEQAAQDEGVKLIWSPSNNDPQKEAQLIDAAVSQKVDGLAVSVPNASAIKDSLAKAKAAGIPIVTLNSGADDFKALGAHHARRPDRDDRGQGGGRAAEGRRASRRSSASSTSRATSASQQRCDGVKQGFGGAGRPTSRSRAPRTSPRRRPRSSPSCRRTSPSTRVITLNPDIASAAKTAIKGASSNAKLATFDLSPNVLKDIQAGDVEFAVDQQQYLQGYLPVVFLKLYRENANTVGGGQPVLTGPGFVDKTNVATVQKLTEAGTR